MSTAVDLLLFFLCCLPQLLTVEISSSSSLLDCVNSDGNGGFIRVAAVLTEDDVAEGRTMAYQAATDLLNRQRSHRGSVCVDLDAIEIQRSSSFRLEKALCKKMEQRGYHAVMGPVDLAVRPHVLSICNALDVPHVSATADHAAVADSSTSQMISVHTQPPLAAVNTAVSDLVHLSNWSRVAVVYERNRAGRAIALQDRLLADGVHCLARRVVPYQERDVLLELKQKDFDVVLMDLASRHLESFFRRCRQVGLHGEGRHFVLVSLNFQGFQTSTTVSNSTGEDTKSGGHSGARNRRLRNFSFYRLVDPEHPVARALADRIVTAMGAANWNVHFDDVVAEEDGRTEALDILALESAIIYDSLLVLTATAEHFGGSFGSSSNTSLVSCAEERPWNLGATFFNYLNAAQMEGVTGKISFKDGQRSRLDLSLMRYSAASNSVRKIGHWTATAKHAARGRGFDGGDELELGRPPQLCYGGLSVLNASLLLNEDEAEATVLTVVTKEEKPYVMLRKGKTGNDAYDGFAIDLLKAISDVIGFKFRLYTVPDNLYGVYNPETGEWNGIVRQLIDRRADLAVASMTINYARETYIDFTKPFMNLGISILFKAPKDPETQLFSFMNPLALEIWLYILLAYILVSMTIWIVARFSPYEWSHPHPCVDTRGLVFQNDFTLPNSFWFAIGTLMQQGSDLNPKAASTRIVGGMWWFFTLIIISSYTANLAAFLTVERMATPIESAEDLAEQSDISYGTLVGGSTLTFFRDAKMETYQKMWRHMESKEAESFVESYEAGVDRVLKGNYAFLCESTMLDYLIQRNCNLTQIGGLLDDKGYGIATPKGSKWTEKISQAILFLQEKGVIQMYYDKWWKKHGQAADHMHERCDTKKTMDQKAMANALGVVNIGGIFVVLLCGLAVAVMVAIAEFCWSARTAKASTTTSEELPPESSLCVELVRTLVPPRKRKVASATADAARNPVELAASEEGGRSDCASCALAREQTNV